LTRRGPDSGDHRDGLIQLNKAPTDLIQLERDLVAMKDAHPRSPSSFVRTRNCRAKAHRRDGRRAAREDQKVGVVTNPEEGGK